MGDVVNGARKFASILCGWLGAAALLAMMMITVVDVGLRAFANIPIRGTLEIVELLLAYSFFLVIPAVLLRDENIVVDILDRTVGPGGVAILRRSAAVITACTFAVMAWQGWIAAKDTLAFGDVSSDLAIPIIYYWVPVLIGFIGAVGAAIWIAVAGSETS